MAFFKLPSHYVFDYKPMFYDPKKERRDTVRKEVRRELGLEQDPNAYRYSIKFRHDNFYHRKIKHSQNVRLAVILVLLVLTGYLILYSDLLDSIFKSFLK